MAKEAIVTVRIRRIDDDSIEMIEELTRRGIVKKLSELRPLIGRCFEIQVADGKWEKLA